MILSETKDACLLNIGPQDWDAWTVFRPICSPGLESYMWFFSSFEIPPRGSGPVHVLHFFCLIWLYRNLLCTFGCIGILFASFKLVFCENFSHMDVFLIYLCWWGELYILLFCHLDPTTPSPWILSSSSALPSVSCMILSKSWPLFSQKVVHVCLYVFLQKMGETVGKNKKTFNWCIQPSSSATEH